MESMNGKRGEGGGEPGDSQTAADRIGTAPLFPFPSSHPDPTPQLAPLRDKHSKYAAVAKTCFELNQFTMNGSSSTLDDFHSGVMRSTLIHDATMAATLSGAFRNLIECLQNHDDRRAKIICAQTLSIVGRGTYAKLRHSPQLFAMRESTNNRLEDEVGTDIPMALIGAALEDPDDGVAASALQALGNLCLSSGATPGTAVEDDLWREIASLVQQRTSQYVPTLADIEDEESYIPMVELQTRIFENVISPRLLQLIWRVTAFEHEQHIGMVMPVLTAGLVHLSKASVASLHTMDRTTYSKRWVEHDYVNLLNTVVHSLILPAMQSALKGNVAHVAALSAIRLVHAAPSASWVDQASYWASLVIKEELSLDNSLEGTMIDLASLLICARALPLPERIHTLLFCLNKIQLLPATLMAPHGIHTAGLLLDMDGLKQYRRPARVAFLAEIALSLFIDGPADTQGDPPSNIRSRSMQSFLNSSEFSEIMQGGEQRMIPSVREEMIVAFCMVAVGVGRRHLDAPEYSSDPSPFPSSYSMKCPQFVFDEWARMSTIILNAFIPCLGWQGDVFGSSSYMDEKVTGLVSAQVSFARLVQDLTHAAGLLSPISVSLKMVPAASPPHVLWDQLEEAAVFLGKYSCDTLTDHGILDSIEMTMDQCVNFELKNDGILNHHLRVYLMAFAADLWVQSRHVAARQEYEGKGPGSNLNASGAIALLQALSPRRIFAKIVENHRSQIEAFNQKQKDLYKKFAQDTVTACVACIENISLSASDWRKRFGNSSEIKSIYTAAMSALQGPDSSAPLLPVCKSAIERIQAVFSSNEPPDLDHLSLSLLLMNSADLRRRPVVTASRRIESVDAYHEGYLVMLSQLIIATRIDKCVFSKPVAGIRQGAARTRNWLRLALPPCPPSRSPKVSVTALPMFTWGSGISAPYGGSDAAAMTVSYSLRRCMRYDGESQFCLSVTMRVHNITAVELPAGVRLSMGMVQESAATSLDGQDPTSQDILKSLGDDGEPFLASSIASSATSLYKAELNSGDHLTWELALDFLPMIGALRLQPCIEYRALEAEPAFASWIGMEGKDGDEDASAMSEMSQKSFKNDGDGKDSVHRTNIVVPGDDMELSPMVGLQPCPMIFFRDARGDIDAFRFLWARLPYQTLPLKIASISDGTSSRDVSCDVLRLACLSTINFGGNAIPGGEITKLWAFSSLSGHRVLVVLAESDSSKRRGVSEIAIHVRGDNKELLCCLTGTASARQAFVAALTPGMKPS